MMAKLMMADELTKLQDVYLHAVTRHVLLQREADAYIASRNSNNCGNDGTTSSSTIAHDHGTDGSSSRRRRRGSSRPRPKRGRKEEGVVERRERLLNVAARRAPAVSCANMEGGLKGIR